MSVNAAIPKAVQSPKLNCYEYKLLFLQIVVESFQCMKFLFSSLYNDHTITLLCFVPTLHLFLPMPIYSERCAVGENKTNEKQQRNNHLLAPSRHLSLQQPSFGKVTPNKLFRTKYH